MAACCHAISMVSVARNGLVPRKFTLRYKICPRVDRREADRKEVMMSLVPFPDRPTNAFVASPGLSRPVDQTSVTNKLLLGLEPRDFQHIAPLLRRVPLRPRQTLIEPNIPVREVYFIERGIASIVSRSRGERPIEVGMIGCLGLVGLPAVLGTNRSPFRCIMQISGAALRMSAEDLQHTMQESAGFRQLLMNYMQALMVQQAQITLCNTRHMIKQRVGRWLLMGLDRLEGNALPVTHDLLGRMLGVRRAGVTVVVSEMEASGILCRGRGQVTILDRDKLERSACDCYSLIRREYDRLIVHHSGSCDGFASDRSPGFGVDRSEPPASADSALPCGEAGRPPVIFRQ
jgi:CRP-like cAMP-binding protein